MIKIRAFNISDLASLREALQQAVKLEHATIPPYLTALYTLSNTGGGVAIARSVLRGIVRQEMLHMTLACNILNAIGEAPKINDPAFVPAYPSALPMGVEVDLTVHLKRYSRDLVATTFMQIEEPEVPLEIRVRTLADRSEVTTIGEFYVRIQEEIGRQGDTIFVPSFQSDAFGAIAVNSVDTARQAISIIIQQGEGTPQSPAGGAATELAHYYRFQQLVKGMKAIQDPSEPIGWRFDPSQPIIIDDSLDVRQMVDDPQLIHYEAADSVIAAMSDDCDKAYTAVLVALHEGFRGVAGRIDDSIDLMTGDLRSKITQLLTQPISAGPHAGKFAGPRFKYAV